MSENLHTGSRESFEPVARPEVRIRAVSGHVANLYSPGATGGRQGRLKVTNTSPRSDIGYTDLLGFGTWSFSIWGPSGQLVFDSGDDFERITAAAPAQ